MKTALFLIFGLLLQSPAFALEQKIASVNELEQNALEFAESITGADGCTLQVFRVRDGIEIRMESESEGTASLVVKYSDGVYFKGETFGSASFSKEYRVEGQGILSAVHADDAYFHVYLEANGKTVGCEFDF